ncbi:uncharacterized protein LOC108676755 isoform X2 [Hyalella azteca]|uniref:Uncharacterized protein LOC108676755 isoform X2 n=1 Tax=Hyalella azteca TaxID=294128 RepID=A0A979FWK5_HYAAZ|nr:uncharacterized protein LOC108676755 isoform X2 [Hyalella azteca]
MYLGNDMAHTATGDTMFDGKGSADTDSKNSSEGNKEALSLNDSNAYGCADSDTVLTIPTTKRKNADVTKFYRYEVKKHKKMVRILTVVAYVICVSMAAIILSLYYVFLWDPNMTKYRGMHLGTTECDDLIKKVKTDADFLILDTTDILHRADQLKEDTQRLVLCAASAKASNATDAAASDRAAAGHSPAVGEVEMPRAEAWTSQGSPASQNNSTSRKFQFTRKNISKFEEYPGLNSGAYQSRLRSFGLSSGVIKEVRTRPMTPDFLHLDNTQKFRQNFSQVRTVENQQERTSILLKDYRSLRKALEPSGNERTEGKELYRKEFPVQNRTKIDSENTPIAGRSNSVPNVLVFTTNQKHEGKFNSSDGGSLLNFEKYGNISKIYLKESNLHNFTSMLKQEEVIKKYDSTNSNVEPVKEVYKYQRFNVEPLEDVNKHKGFNEVVNIVFDSDDDVRKNIPGPGQAPLYASYSPSHRSRKNNPVFRMISRHPLERTGMFSLNSSEQHRVDTQNGSEINASHVNRHVKNIKGENNSVEFSASRTITTTTNYQTRPEFYTEFHRTKNPYQLNQDVGHDASEFANTGKLRVASKARVKSEAEPRSDLITEKATEFKDANRLQATENIPGAPLTKIFRIMDYADDVFEDTIE